MSFSHVDGHHEHSSLLDCVVPKIIPVPLSITLYGKANSTFWIITVDKIFNHFLHKVRPTLHVFVMMTLDVVTSKACIAT